MNFPNIKPYLKTKKECLDFCERHKNNKLTVKDIEQIKQDPTLIATIYRVIDDLITSDEYLAKINFEKIEQEKEKNPYPFLNYKILNAKYLISKHGDYKEALSIFHTVLTHPHLANFPYLKQNVLIHTISILTENGDFYKSLEKIDQLKKVTNGLKMGEQYANYLEAYVLLFLGYNIKLKNLIGEQEHILGSQDLQVMLDFVENNIDNIKKLLLTSYSIQDFEKNGFIALFDTLLEGVLITNNSELIDLAKCSWPAKYIEYNIKEYPNYTRVKVMALLLDMKYECENIDSKEPNEINSISDLELAFLFLLLANKNNNVDKKEMYLKKITTFCLEKRIQNPFFPFFHEGKWYPDSHISNKLSDLLKIGTTSNKDEKIIVEDTLISYFNGEELISKIDLTKSLTTITLFKIISGPAKSEFTKCYIHEKLSGTSYNKIQHDNRLHKLLSRTIKTLEKSGIKAPWYMPKNNSIILNYRIELKM